MIRRFAPCTRGDTRDADMEETDDGEFVRVNDMRPAIEYVLPVIKQYSASSLADLRHHLGVVSDLQNLIMGKQI